MIELSSSRGCALDNEGKSPVIFYETTSVYKVWTYVCHDFHVSISLVNDMNTLLECTIMKEQAFS